jgi:hypothetical protein
MLAFVVGRRTTRSPGRFWAWCHQQQPHRPRKHPRGSGHQRGGLEPLDPVAIIVLLATEFRSGVTSGAFLVPVGTASCPPPPDPLGAITGATLDPSPLEPLGTITDTALGLLPPEPVGTIVGTAPSSPPLEPCTCSTVALLEASYPSDAGAETELPSPRTNLLFSGEAVSLVDGPTSLGGDRESSLGVDPDMATFSFPLPKLEVVPAPLWPPTASVLGIYTPRDASLIYRIAISMLSSMGISFSSFDLIAWSMKIGK